MTVLPCVRPIEGVHHLQRNGVVVMLVRSREPHVYTRPDLRHLNLHPVWLGDGSCEMNTDHDVVGYVRLVPLRLVGDELIEAPLLQEPWRPQAGQAARTRSGLRVVDLEIVDTESPWALHSPAYAQRWKSDGRWHAAGLVDHPLDLVGPWDEALLESERGVMWLNVYPSDGNHPFSCAFRSRADADSAAGDTRLACVRVPWMEGQFDDEEDTSDDL